MKPARLNKPGRVQGGEEVVIFYHTLSLFASEKNACIRMSKVVLRWQR